MGIDYRDRGSSWFASVPRGKCLANKLARATATSYRILWLSSITRGMHSGDTRFKSRTRNRYTDSLLGRSPQPLRVNITITFKQASTASSHTPSGATFTHINKSHSKILLHKRSCWQQHSEITKSCVGLPVPLSCCVGNITGVICHLTLYIDRGVHLPQIRPQAWQLTWSPIWDPGWLKSWSALWTTVPDSRKISAVSSGNCVPFRNKSDRANF